MGLDMVNDCGFSELALFQAHYTERMLFQEYCSCLLPFVIIWIGHCL